MKKLHRTPTTALLVATLILTLAGFASAEVSKGVQKAFRGEILITDGPLPPIGATDAETISTFKKARKKALKHIESEGVAEWSFQFTAFLKKPSKVTAMSFDFYTDDKEKLYVANKRLMGVDPKAVIIAGALNITEDDGLNRNRRYIVKLTGTVKGKERTFATTKVAMK